MAVIRIASVAGVVRCSPRPRGDRRAPARRPPTAAAARRRSRRASPRGSRAGRRSRRARPGRPRRPRARRPRPPRPGRSARPPRRPARPGAMPSCAAPQVIGPSAPSPSIGDLLTTIVAGRTSTPGERQARNGRWPGRGPARRRRGRGGGGRAAPGEHHVDVAPVRAPRPTRTPRSARPVDRSCGSLQVEHHAQRVAAAHQGEGLLDRVERQPPRHQPVERQPAAAVRARAARGCRARAARSRRRSRGCAAPSAGSSARAA